MAARHYNNALLDGMVTEILGGGVFTMESSTPIERLDVHTITIHTQVRANPDDPIYDLLRVGTEVRVTGPITEAGMLANTLSLKGWNNGNQ